VTARIGKPGGPHGGEKIGKNALMSQTRSGFALAALAIGTFALGLTEFVITGLLPDIAADLHVTIPRAGLLISGYALSVVIGGPLVTALVARRSRKPVLISLLAFFVVGNVISALATSYGVMLGGRIVTALCHGSFIGFATIVAGDLVPPARRSSAIAAMLSGLTIANVAGVPLGTLLGQQLGWRATFWAMAVFGLVAALATAVFVAPSSAVAGLSVRTQLAAFKTGRVWLALALTALAFGAVYAPFTYVAPLMTSVAGFSTGALPWLLALFGLGLVLGNVIGARAADRRLMPTLLAASAAMLVVLVLFAWTAHSRWPAAATLFALGVVAYATVPGLTTRVVTSADGAGQNLLASSAAVSAFNLGNAAGAYLGGLAISAGLGYAATPLIGAAMEAGALVIAAGSVLAARRAAVS
jgi:DHA1 family inner membrane transport protein